MIEVYWGMLITGVIFAAVVLIFGDLLGDALDGIFEAVSPDSLDVLSPPVIVGAITIFGGSGILLTKYSPLNEPLVGILAGTASVVLSALIFFFYVKPMKRTESSIGFSVTELVGRPAEVSIPIPSQGYGEVSVKIGAGSTYQIAASANQKALAVGTRVVVVGIDDGTLLVVPFEAD